MEAGGGAGGAVSGGGGAGGGDAAAAGDGGGCGAPATGSDSGGGAGVTFTSLPAVALRAGDRGNDEGDEDAGECREEKRGRTSAAPHVSSSPQSQWPLAGAGPVAPVWGTRRAGRDANTLPPRRWIMASTARCPRTLFPAGSSGGENVPIAKRPGTTATMPPPTPLFAGTPTL